MSWVSAHEAKEWIKDHALPTPESVIDQNGFYDEGKVTIYFIGLIPTSSASISMTVPDPPLR